MFTFLLIAQADVTAVGNAKGLETLNSLGFAVFIIGLVLIYLLVAHWSRMKTNLEKKHKSKERKVKPGQDDGDMLTQLEFMSREELKVMILSERAKNADKAVEAPVAGSAGAHPEITDGSNKAGDELLLFNVSPSSGADATGVEMGKENIGEVRVDEKVVTPAESPGRVAPVKNPYSDKVERVPTFEELQDELKKTSRRI